MSIIIADENGIREVDNDGNVICPECNATNDCLQTRCRNCGTKIKQTELTYEQEDLLIEMGMEKAEIKISDGSLPLTDSSTVFEDNAEEKISKWKLWK